MSIPYLQCERMNPKVIDHTKVKRTILAQLMSSRDRKILETHRAQDWSKAQKAGAKLLKKHQDEDVYVRLHDPEDASLVDFLTVERLIKARNKYYGEIEALAEGSVYNGKSGYQKNRVNIAFNHKRR